jgi:hypothetical protein
MATAFFLLFVVSVTAASVWLWRKRVEDITQATAEREHARATAMGLIPHLARQELERKSAADADAVVNIPEPEATPIAEVPRPAPPPNLPPPVSRPESRPAFRPDAPPDGTVLKGIRRRDFAALGVAYFEASGLRVEKQDGSNGIDALLYTAGSEQPVMAVRWSRHLKRRSGEDEIAEFAQACAAQHVAHGTFIAQHGVDPKALPWAFNSGVTLLNAAQFAQKLTTVPASNFARFHALARGLK